jgi:hypothetical protein
MRFAGLLAVGAAVALTACSDTTQPPLTTDLSGSYNLQSIAIASVTEPNSNGTLQLTTSGYDLALTVNGQIQPEDVGTYGIEIQTPGPNHRRPLALSRSARSHQLDRRLPLR